MLPTEKVVDIEQDGSKQSTQSKLSPWKAASLSLLLPGVGHAYIKCWLRAVILFILYISLYIAPIYPICYSLYSATIVLFFQSNILPLCAGLDVVYCYKKSRRNRAEKSQILDKNPWLAVFLSLILPGLGHAYLKRWYLSIVFSLTYLSLNLLPVGNLFIVISTILFKILVCIHVYKVSINTSLRKDFYKFAFFALLILLSVNIAMPQLTSRYFIRAISANGVSMEPTIRDEDLIIINRLAYVYKEPKVGDIVSIDSNFLADSNFISKPYIQLYVRQYPFFTKRVVAIGGDVIHITKDGVNVSNKTSEQFEIDYRIELSTCNVNGLDKIERIDALEAYTVPENSFFVLGDNIKESIDSRDFGAVPKDMIIGKVIKIYH